MPAVINDNLVLPDTGSTIALMKHEPIVSRATYESLSRLLPHVSQQRIAQGAVLYRAGSPATVLYFVLEGAMQLPAVNVNKPRVLVLHSYDTEYSWTRDISTGLTRTFSNKAYTMRWHYMDTKRNPDEAFKQRAGLLARRIIDDWNPTVIIAIDDDAQRYAVKNYVDHPKIKIVFAGINGEIAPYGYDKAQNVTGILERKQWQSVKNLIGESVRPRVPAGRAVKIAYVGDTSGSVKEDTQFLEAFDWQPFVLHRSKLVKTFDEWKTDVRRAEAEADVLITTNYRRIQLPADDPKKMVSPEELVKWTEDNTPEVLVIGTNGFYVEDGGHDRTRHLTV